MGRHSSLTVLAHMGAVLRWVLAIIVLACAITLPALIPRWTSSGIVVVGILEATLALLVLGLLFPVRCHWALRSVGLMVFLAFLWYAIDQILSPTAPVHSGQKSHPSVVNALMGLAVFGVPGLVYALRGSRRTQVESEEAGAGPAKTLGKRTHGEIADHQWEMPTHDAERGPGA